MSALIRVSKVSKRYKTTGDYFSFNRVSVPAVRDVSLEIRAGVAFGLVGESGSGKSTLARLITGLETPDEGRIEVAGIAMPPRSRKEWQALRRKVQIIFQDPYAALDPLMTVGNSVEEPLVNLTEMDRDARRSAAIKVLRSVGLPERVYAAYPHQLSGGERQRVCIARALAPRPEIVVCDEPVSSLDQSTQAQVIELLRELQRSHGLTLLFISHDLSVVNQLCDEVAVMHRGELIERGTRQQVMSEPTQVYTRALLDAAKYFQHAVPALA